MKQIKNKAKIERSPEDLLKIQDLQKHINQIAKSKKDLTLEQAEDFVSSKMKLSALFQNISDEQYMIGYKIRQEENKKEGKSGQIELGGTIKDGKFIKFGFSEKSKQEIYIAQSKLIASLNTNLQPNHNQYIYKILTEKYPNISIEYVDFAILPTQKLDPNLYNLGTISQTNRRPQDLDKILKAMAMIDILSKQNDLVINKIYISQYHDNSMVRKTDYIAIHITIGDNLKTILINDEYGESSFVVDGHLTKQELATLDKYDYRGYELKYDQNESDWLGRFRDKIIEKKNNKFDLIKNKSSDKKAKLSKLEINQQKINDIMKLFEDKITIYNFEYQNAGKTYIYNGKIDGVFNNNHIHLGFMSKYSDIYLNIPKSFGGFNIFFEKGIVKGNELLSGATIKLLIAKYISKNKDNPKDPKLLNASDRQGIQQESKNILYLL